MGSLNCSFFLLPYLSPRFYPHPSSFVDQPNTCHCYVFWSWSMLFYIKYHLSPTKPSLPPHDILSFFLHLPIGLSCLVFIYMRDNKKKVLKYLEIEGLENDFWFFLHLVCVKSVGLEFGWIVIRFRFSWIIKNFALFTFLLIR